MSIEAYQGLTYFFGGCFAVALSIILLYWLSKTIGPNPGTQQGSTASLANAWSGIETLDIVDVYNPADGIKAFVLKRNNDGLIGEFKAGQFLSFLINDDAKTLRSYSIASSNTNQSTITVAVKKIPDGLGSAWFHSKKKGDKVQAYSPQGIFTPDKPSHESQHILIAGGIGITPLLSMIKSHLDQGLPGTLNLFYVARQSTGLAFHEELLVLSKQHDRLNYFPSITGEEKDWTHDRGRINLNAIKDKITPNKNARVYMCGPEEMMVSLEGDFIQEGLSKENIHFEKFISPVSLDPEQFPHVEATVKHNGQALSYNGKHLLLDFLENNNIPLEFSCRAGVCGSCKCKLNQGEVTSLTDSGLTPEEKAQGYILTCVSVPKGDIELSS